MPEKKPLIAITMGDASGVGPETVVKALASERVTDACRPLVIGSAEVLAAVIESLGSPLSLHAVPSPEEAEGHAGRIDLLDLANLEVKDVLVGQVCASCGKASMEYIEEACKLAVAGRVDAVTTTPINKEATKLGGYGDVGHLEYFARATGTTDYATMLASGNLRTVHLTTHYSLKEAVEKVTKERILSRLVLTDRSFRAWGFASPRIAVAALNPHGGESGMFGREEIEEISPAVEEAKRRGIDARGPFPADTVFVRAMNGEFDAVLALYHDQGHIPVKVHGFDESISVALGLPFIRTSVDHGTAFDIAGKGIAQATSLEEAILTAVKLVEGRLE